MHVETSAGQYKRGDTTLPILHVISYEQYKCKNYLLVSHTSDAHIYRFIINALVKKEHQMLLPVQISIMDWNSLGSESYVFGVMNCLSPNVAYAFWLVVQPLVAMHKTALL